MKTKTEDRLRDSIVRVMRKNAEDIRWSPPKLTAEDWEEIYYALDWKLESPAVKGDRKWIAHLRRIMKTIGPDGKNMTPRSEQPVF